MLPPKYNIDCRGCQPLNSKSTQKSGVEIIGIDAASSGQRLDNFLARRLEGIPRTRIYRIIRKGEVRVNGGRRKPEYKLVTGDAIRIPPLRIEPSSNSARQPGLLWEWRVRCPWTFPRFLRSVCGRLSRHSTSSFSGLGL